MPRLIDADKCEKDLIDRTYCTGYGGLTRIDVRNEMARQPTVDAVEVVRCKDCKWGTPHPEGDEYTKCFKLCTTFFSGHYCAWGERREDAIR